MATQISIVFLIDAIYAETAGTEKQLLEVLKRIDRQKFAPHLICLRSSEWLARQRLPLPVTTLGYEGFLKRNFPGVVQKLAKLIDGNGIQIVHTFFEDAVFVGLLSKYFSRRKPLLLVSRRDLGLGDEPWYHRLFPILRSAIKRGLDGMVVNAEAIRDHLTSAEKFPTERIQVIPNGVEIPCLNRRPEICSDTASFRVVMTANLKPVKRHDILIDALARMQTICPERNVEAYLLGEGHLKPELARQASVLGIAGKVHFLGAQTEVWEFLSRADVGVLCSDREGLSNAILEYMACGLPVVATAVGGNSELINDANGILVSPGNSRELADALVKLARDPELRREMGAASLSKIRQDHLWGRVMRQWEGYYSSVVSSVPMQKGASCSI